MTATKVGRDTALAQIIKVVEDAQGSKAPIQRLADQISGIFVPIVVGIAFVTFFIWILFIDRGNFTQALEVLIAVLVIACPCALGLATPTSIMAGSGKATETPEKKTRTRKTKEVVEEAKAETVEHPVETEDDLPWETEEPAAEEKTVEEEKPKRRTRKARTEE